MRAAQKEGWKERMKENSKPARFKNRSMRHPNSRRSSKGLPPAEGLWKSGGRVTRVAKRAGGGNRISKYLQPDYWLRIVSEYPVIRPAICGKGQTERAIDGERWRDRRGLSGAHSL